MSFLSDDHGCPGWRGEMAERIRTLDWSTTGLGPLQQWSPALRQAVQYLLASPMPLLMLWGTDGYMIYNDAYAVFAGGRHPYLLGTAVELADHDPLRGHETVLVVEDDPGVRQTAIELLRLLGYQVEAASNGDEVMALLRQGLPVDLIFSDVVMPGRIKSADLAAWARQQHPPIPVLFASGYTREVITRNNELHAGTYLLSKPYSPQDLDTMLRTVLTQQPLAVGSVQG